MNTAVYQNIHYASSVRAASYHPHNVNCVQLNIARSDDGKELEGVQISIFNLPPAVALALIKALGDGETVVHERGGSVALPDFLLTKDVFDRLEGVE